MKDCKNSRHRAIRLKCLDCSGGNSAEVRRCGHADCPLWYHRFGVSVNEAEKRTPGCFDITTVRQWQEDAYGSGA